MLALQPTQALTFALVGGFRDQRLKNLLVLFEGADFLRQTALHVIARSPGFTTRQLRLMPARRKGDLSMVHSASQAETTQTRRKASLSVDLIGEGDPQDGLGSGADRLIKRVA
jgi:hypothetical protein